LKRLATQRTAQAAEKRERESGDVERSTDIGYVFHYFRSYSTGVIYVVNTRKDQSLES
jgi:hypothetical protein